MAYWETAHTVPGQEPFILEWARIWRAADKIVYSTTLREVAGERTRIERTFAPEAVRRLKAETDLDIAVAVPHLAAQAIRAGWSTSTTSSSDRRSSAAAPHSSPNDVRVDLKLLDERRFGNGTVHLRYGARDIARG